MLSLLHQQLYITWFIDKEIRDSVSLVIFSRSPQDIAESKPSIYDSHSSVRSEFWYVPSEIYRHKPSPGRKYRALRGAQLVTFRCYH